MYIQVIAIDNPSYDLNINYMLFKYCIGII